jgi:hypothetical protein
MSGAIEPDPVVDLQSRGAEPAMFPQHQGLAQQNSIPTAQDEVIRLRQLNIQRSRQITDAQSEIINAEEALRRVLGSSDAQRVTSTIESVLSILGRIQSSLDE